MIEITPFRLGDLAAFEPGSVDCAAMARSRFEAVAPNWEGYAATVRESGRVLAIAGIAVDGRDGLGWILLSDRLRARPFTLHRLVLRTLRIVLDTWPIDRLRVEVPHGFDSGKQWVRRLGFRPAGETDAFTVYERTPVCLSSSPPPLSLPAAPQAPQRQPPDLVPPLPGSRRFSAA